MSPIYRLVAQKSLLERVWIFRLVNLFLASLCVPLCFAGILKMTGDRTLAIAATALLVTMPGLYIANIRVSNDALAMLLTSAIVVASIHIISSTAERKSWRWALVLGLLTAASMLTKAYCLSSLGAILIVSFAVRKTKPKLAWTFGLAAIVAIAASGWYYGGLLKETGSITGEQHDVALAGQSTLRLLRNVAKVDWAAALDSTFLSYIWFGGWSFLQVRSWMYRVFALMWAMALAGSFWHAYKSQGARRLQMYVVASLFGVLMAGLAYHVLITFSVSGISASAGWYLYNAVLPEITLLAIGLNAIGGLRTLPVAATCFCALETFGLWLLMIPYYCGLVVHGSGAVPAAKLEMLATTGWREILERLAHNKPGFVTPRTLVFLFFVFVICTVTPVWIATLQSIRRRS